MLELQVLWFPIGGMITILSFGTLRGVKCAVENDVIAW
jgi:hypothetical protein